MSEDGGAGDNANQNDSTVSWSLHHLEDVLVWVKHFTFPANFVVMDIEEDANIPLILGRPFMLTASYVVDMGRRKLEMGIEDQKISFNLFDEQKQLLDQNVCLQVKEFEEKVLKVGTKFDPDPWGIMRQANDVKRALLGRQPSPF